MAAKQAMKENLQCTSKYGHLRISQDICHVRMTDIEGFLTIYGHSENLLNNNSRYPRVTFLMTPSKMSLFKMPHVACALEGSKLSKAFLLFERVKIGDILMAIIQDKINTTLSQ